MDILSIGLTIHVGSPCMLPVFSTFSNYVTEEYDSHLLDLLIFIQAWISLFDKDMHKT